MESDVFTNAAVDNIYKPSSTTSKESFHGTGLSVIQHHAFADYGLDQNIVIVGGSAGQETAGHLPSYYREASTVVAPQRHLYHLAPWRL